MQGRIIKGIAGFYYVYDVVESVIYECKAKGIFRREMIELLHRSSSQYKHPDTELGYGIPDFYKAYKKEKKNGKRAK